jgi:hypothetical protein
MTRSRLVVLASFLVVGLGIVAAVGALYLDPARAAVGPLPAEGLALPANTSFVMGLDVQRFVNSPFYKRQVAMHAGRPKPFSELEEKIGLNPERDVDLVLMAGTGRDSGVVLVRGRFDQYKLARMIETSKKGVTTKKHEGVVIYLHDEGKPHAMAVAFLEDEVVVMGHQPGVEATITSHAQGSGGLKGNAALVALLERVKPGSTFWMVGDQTLLAQMPSSVPSFGGAQDGKGNTVAPSLGLPALKSVVATGDLDPEVSFDLTAETGTEADARNLADVVRGLVAMASLQSSQKPELKGLTSAVSVTTEANRVRLSAHLPYELLDALQPKPMPKARPSGQ